MLQPWKITTYVQIEDEAAFVKAAKQRAKDQGISEAEQDLQSLLEVWFEPLDAAPVEVPPGCTITVFAEEP